MVKTMQNLAAAYKQTVEWTIQKNQFIGFKAGSQRFSDALDSSVGSGECDHLFSALAALKVGPTLSYTFTQWRAARQGKGVRKQHAGDFRIAGTDFFGGN